MSFCEERRSFFFEFPRVKRLFTKKKRVRLPVRAHNDTHSNMSKIFFQPSSVNKRVLFFYACCPVVHSYSCGCSSRCFQEDQCAVISPCLVPQILVFAVYGSFQVRFSLEEAGDCAVQKTDIVTHIASSRAGPLF